MSKTQGAGIYIAGGKIQKLYGTKAEKEIS